MSQFYISLLSVALMVSCNCSASQFISEVPVSPKFKELNSPKKTRAAQVFAASVQRQHEKCLGTAGANQLAVQECHEHRSNFVLMVKAGQQSALK